MKRQQYTCDKTATMSIRLSPSLRTFLQSQATKYGMTLSEYVISVFQTLQAVIV